MSKIYFYWPNIIGYIRVLSAIAGFCVVWNQPDVFFLCYFISEALDALDGVTARALDQCSKFGAVLDMLTDRMSTAVLLVVLSHLFPKYWGVFAGLLVLDIVSHWCQTYAKLSQKLTTHKGSKNPLLNFYYTFPYALLVVCVAQELFLLCVYLLSSAGQSSILLPFAYPAAVVSFPIFALKQIINVVQLVDAVAEIVDLDEVHDK
jgi:CDP-diacylglycerol--inositol 3-phosphatidyltransferase